MSAVLRTFVATALCASCSNSGESGGDAEPLGSSTEMTTAMSVASAGAGGASANAIPTLTGTGTETTAPGSTSGPGVTTDPVGAAGSAGEPTASAGAGGTPGGGGTGGVASGGGGSGGEASGASGAAAGGAPLGGAAGVGGAGGEGSGDDMSMSFFVTSTGMGDGGNLGGLEGADAFCAMLATTVDPELGQKTWRAYLSTDSVDARDRIGAGPWRNAELLVVASGVDDLHAQEPGEALDDTWPPMEASIALDENGEPLENSVHDVLTGTLVDGTAAEGLHCGNWTSNDPADSAQVGHTNRTGGGRPPYFNATHEVGCAEGSANYESGSVTQGGGRGSFYCFAVD